MSKFKFLLPLMLLFSMFFDPAIASVDDHLNDFFNGLGYQSNTTSSNAYQGQAAGYYTGGSLYLRNQVKNYQMVAMELPSFSGGCSGIDTYLGAFSVINSSQLNQMVKNILSAGGAYAMDLALTTTLPQIKSVKDGLQTLLNTINMSNINTCNTAEDLVGGVWPKTRASEQQICRDLGSHTGALKDWASARQECGTGGQFNNIMNNAGQKSRESIVNKNLVWESLMQNTFTSSDANLAELLMSLSGTIIIRNNKGGNPESLSFPSLIDNNFLRAFLYGGDSITIYSCDETKKCLNPTKKSITISTEKGLVNQVSKIIAELNRDVKSDTGELSPAVRGFLEMTPIPILKLISTEESLGLPLDTTQYSEVVAIGLLDQYLSEDIKLVKQALDVQDTPMDLVMQNRIDTAQIAIAHSLTAAYKKLQNTILLTTSMRSMEQQLSSRLQGLAFVGQENE